MIPVESQALAEAMFWFVVLMLIMLIGGLFICHIYDCIEETPEEQAQREADRIARQATKEFKRRKRMRSIRFWNF